VPSIHRNSRGHDAKHAIVKVEEHLNANQKGPVQFAVIYVGAPDADERLCKSRQEYRAEYGCLDGLRVIRTHVPEPMPLPAAFKKI